MPTHRVTTESLDLKPSFQVGGVATSGMLWSLLGTTLSKGASFGAQLVLGWLLSKEDFALYAHRHFLVNHCNGIKKWWYAATVDPEGSAIF